jgi:hypothetical protein
MTDHFELSTMTGTRAISGSEATRFKKVVMDFSESSMASSMLTSIIWAPLSTCCLATATAASKSPARMSLENLGEPVTLVRSPMLTKFVSGRIVSGSSPLRRVYGETCGGTRLGSPRTACAIALM